MTYLQRKKLAFMSIVNQIKGFVRTVTGIPPLTLTDCVDEDSIINYTIGGNSVQDGTPTPEAPVEVESVGEKTINLFNPEEVIAKFKSGDTYTHDGYTCTSIQLKPNTKYYIKTFTPVYTGGYFYLSVNGDVNSYATGTIDLNDAVGNAYPRGQEETVTTGDTGCMYVGYLYLKKNRDKALREGSIQIVEGNYTKATAPDYEPYGKYKIPVVCGQLLDYVKYKKGYFINSSGVEEAQGGYKCTEDYIPVLPNTNYRIVCENGTPTSSFYLTIPFYDKDKTFISRSSFGAFTEIPKIREFTTPNDCYYIRFSLPNAHDYDVSLYNLDNTTNIYLDEPLAEGQTIEYKTDNLPKLPTIKGTTIYSIDTAIQPSNMSATYYSTSKE